MNETRRFLAFLVSFLLFLGVLYSAIYIIERRDIRSTESSYTKIVQQQRESTQKVNQLRGEIGRAGELNQRAIENTKRAGGVIRAGKEDHAGIRAILEENQRLLGDILKGTKSED